MSRSTTLRGLSGRPTLMATLATVLLSGIPSAVAAEEGQRTFEAAIGGKLVLDLEAGADVEIVGTGGASVVVDYRSDCRPACAIDFRENGDRLTIRTAFRERSRKHNSSVDLRIEVPSVFDIKVDSMGGGLSIDGVDGTFTGKTMGGHLTLHDVRGEARLETMGGPIKLTNSELDGRLETMGGEVLFENVVGDVKGSSMGGNVRYKNVERRDGQLGSPPRTGDDLRDASVETVQVSTMGGGIRVEDAPEGADLHTMGGEIEVADARGFVRAETMGGDIKIDSVDGWVDATTMGGHIEVHVTGAGGDVSLESMSGDIELSVPPGFGMALDLEIAFTRNSRKDYVIDAPGGFSQTVTPDWDYDHGTPRKLIRMAGTVDGGGHTVKVRTVNGNITIREE